jgi:hypothetical protein
MLWRNTLVVRVHKCRHERALLILWVGVVTCSQEVISKLNKEYDAWLATFRNSKPIVSLPVPVLWTRIFSVIMVVAMIFFWPLWRGIQGCAGRCKRSRMDRRFALFEEPLSRTWRRSAGKNSSHCPA